MNGDAESLVANLARTAATCGLDGVVASPHEIQVIRETVSNPNFIIVTPGIRPISVSVATDDQRRVMTAAEAMRAGADYLVIGRPILKAGDPVAAANAIVAEIEGGPALVD
jgi:orotidine-5'-phosphate decarboxylase